MPTLFRPHWFSVIDSGCDWFAAAACRVPLGRAPCSTCRRACGSPTPLARDLAASPPAASTRRTCWSCSARAPRRRVLTETAGGGGPAGAAGGLPLRRHGDRRRQGSLPADGEPAELEHGRLALRPAEGGRARGRPPAVDARRPRQPRSRRWRRTWPWSAAACRRQVNGVMFTEGRQHLVYNTLQHHEAPSCTSDLLYKGALQDRSPARVAGHDQGRQGRPEDRRLPAERQPHALERGPGRLDPRASRSRPTTSAARTAPRAAASMPSRSSTPRPAASRPTRRRGWSWPGFFQQVFDRITIPQVREALARAIGSRIRRVT